MKMKKQANRNIRAITQFSSFAASPLIAIDLESIYARHADYCMTRMDTEEQNLLNGYLMKKSQNSAQYAIKETSQEFDAVFPKKFRMKNIDEHCSL